MDFSSLLGNLLTVAKNLAPMVVPGAGPAIAAAEAAMRAIDTVRGSGELSPADDAKAVAGRAALEERVNLHANKTADSLGG